MLEGIGEADESDTEIMLLRSLQPREADEPRQAEAKTRRACISAPSEARLGAREGRHCRGTENRPDKLGMTSNAKVKGGRDE